MNKIETRIIGLIQMACTNDPKQNLQNAIDSIREAAKKGAQIICLPELFLSSYFCQTENPEHFSLAEPIPGPTSNSLAKLAKELETVLIVPLFEKRTEGIYHNSAVVIDADGSLSGTYRKMHIPDDPCFHEKYYFTPGDNGFISFSTRYGKIGVLICWDQWFPEAARLTALTGAQFLFYPTAIGYQESDRAESPHQIVAWETVQKSHAISNGLFVA
ncbi:carbon-nitrogen hydrolase, partial [Nitrospinaceae bacterium]|nr:carbon-nitrogen hydrolase [Nitrospinaceae bacterium]